MMQQGQLRAVERMPETQLIRPNGWRWMQTGDVVLHDRFTILRTGVGEAPGTYYTASDSMSGDDVLMRTLQMSEPPGSAALIRLRHDIRRVATSPHPHIVRVLDHDAQEDMLLLATDLHGTSLRELLEQRRLALSEALLFAQHVGAALSFAHVHGVIHGMITPATIDVIGEKSARVSDFGLSQVSYGFSEPCPGDIRQRPGYLPPEASNIAFPTPSIDIFQLGALLWEMCLGEPPPPQYALKILDERTDVPDEIREIIIACMQPRPEARPQQIGSILSGIRVARQMLAGKPSSSIMVRLRYQRTNTVMLDETQLRLLAQPEATPPAPLSQPTPPTPSDEAASIGTPPPPPAHLLKHKGSTLPMRNKLLVMASIMVALAVAVVVARGHVQSNVYAAPSIPNDVILQGSQTILTARSTPYHVTQTVVIGAGQSLQVQPGATLAFAPGAALVVQGGTLTAQGTPNLPILFTSATDPALQSTTVPVQLWQGIQVLASNGTPGQATLSGITIRYAGTNASNAGITCRGGTLTLLNSTQSDSAGIGLEADAQCTGEVAHTTFQRDLGVAANVANTALHFHDNNLFGSGVTVP